MSKTSLVPVAAAMAVLFGVAPGAMAAPVTFFGEDTNGAAIATSHPNADAARGAFFSNLNGVGTETFEDIAVGSSSPLLVTFPGAGTATLTGTGSVQSGVSVNQQFPISGSRYFNTTGTFTLSFSSPMSVFGFYGTDIGDVGAALTLILTGSNGVSNLTVPNLFGGNTDGSALYFGFYDTVDSYTSISLVGAGADQFGFDDFSIGARSQVMPSPVPEPASITLLLMGLLGLDVMRRARR